MTDWQKLIGGGFAHMNAPFALHPYDQGRAREYRSMAKKAGLSWNDVVEHFDEYANRKGWSSEATAKQFQYFSKYMKKHFG